MRTAVHDTEPLPVSHYWGLIKGLDDSQKLELASLLIDSVKPMLAASMHDTSTEDDFPAIKEEHLRPYTMEEINAMIDQSERDIAEGKGQDFDDFMRELEEEFAEEDRKELAMLEAV